MGTVMIRCPRTDRAVSTEIETEASVFHRLPEVASRLRCPACGEDARLDALATHGSSEPSAGRACQRLDAWPAVVRAANSLP